MVITQEELKSRFKGSGYIVGNSTICHVCDGGHTILTFHEKNKTYIVSVNTDSTVAANLIDNGFLKYFKYTKLMSWYLPEPRYSGRLFRMYELKEWRC